MIERTWNAEKALLKSCKLVGSSSTRNEEGHRLFLLSMKMLWKYEAFVFYDLDARYWLSSLIWKPASLREAPWGLRENHPARLHTHVKRSVDKSTKHEPIFVHETDHSNDWSALWTKWEDRQKIFECAVDRAVHKAKNQVDSRSPIWVYFFHESRFVLFCGQRVDSVFLYF